MIGMEKHKASQFDVNIKVLGVGSGGCNAVHNMVNSGILNGIDFIAVNTDQQVLDKINVPTKLTIGLNLTRGLGAGGNPDVAAQAAMDDKDKIRELIDGTNLLFLATGMGGGTGTGATPVIAEIAKEMGILTIAVVTKPFELEGERKMKYAEDGIAKLKETIDAVIVIPNERLRLLENGEITIFNAFKMADDVLLDSVRGISELLDKTGLVNVDFNDLKRVMEIKGDTFIGMGIGVGENKAIEAVEKAISCPLMEDLTMDGAEEVLVNVITGADFGMNEFDKVLKIINEKTGGYNNVKYGIVPDSTMEDEIKITVIAKGFSSEKSKKKSIIGNSRRDEEGKIDRLKLTSINSPDFTTPAVLRRKAD